MAEHGDGRLGGLIQFLSPSSTVPLPSDLIAATIRAAPRLGSALQRLASFRDLGLEGLCGLVPAQYVADTGAGWRPTGHRGVWRVNSGRSGAHLARAGTEHGAKRPAEARRIRETQIARHRGDGLSVLAVGQTTVCLRQPMALDVGRYTTFAFQQPI